MAAHASIASLLRSEATEESAHKDEGVCVLGIFGKSALGSGCTKESVVNLLADKGVFGGFGASAGRDGADAGACSIEAHYSRESRVLYLVLTSVLDNARLVGACEALAAGLGHAEAQAQWREAESAHCLHLLFVFSVCHVLLLVHPTCTFDVTYERVFRAVDALRQKALPVLRAALRDCPVSKEWRLSCRPCPPRLLFAFHAGPAGRGACGGAEGPRRPSPRRRLQHALEDQIYRIFRKSRVLTNQSANCLFTVPSNQAFVYVLPGPDPDPVGSLLAHLRAACTPCDPALDPARAPPPAAGAGADGTLRDFLWQHVELVLQRRGFDDSVGRNPQPAHFELPTYAEWASVAAELYRAVTEAAEGAGGGATGGGAEAPSGLRGQLKVLEGFLDADARFSEGRCQKALPLAHAAYQSNLPHNYTTTVHKNQLAQALRVYGQHARGVAFQRYALQLHEDCYKFWSNGHQLCEERSLTDQHCVHKFHLLPEAGEKPDMEHNPPILYHNSRGRSTSSCNCGRKQAPREDPFDILSANYDFYQMLEEKCCSKLDRINFPVFQASTPDPAPASDRGPGPPGPPEAERLREKETVTDTPGESTSLSLALSLGQSTGSPGPYGEGGEGHEKRPSVDRQASTVEYLPGMLHSGCPKGLLPKFSSWSLVKLGPARAYNSAVGLEQPGFLQGSGFLLPWDVVVRGRAEDDPDAGEGPDGGGGALSSWPTPATKRGPVGEGSDGGGGGASSWPAPVKASVAKRGPVGEGSDGGVGAPSSWPAPAKAPAAKRGPAAGVGRGRRRDDVARAYVGFEYEDGRGRRFLGSAPDKVVKVLGPGGARETAGRALGADMPLYVPSPAQGRGLKPHYAQLTRLFVVVPDAPVEITLCPQVQPGPPPCPVFHPEQAEVVLPPDGTWVLRFPYAYVTDRGPCYPPKENQPLANFRVLKGILRANTAGSPAP